MLVLIAMQHGRKKTTDSYQETSILDRRYLRTGRNLGLFTLLYKGFDFMTKSSFTDKPSRDARKVMFQKKKFRASSLHIKRTSIPRFFSIRQCLELFPPIALRRFTRVSPERFKHLLASVGPLLKKKPCRSRQPISDAEHQVTLSSRIHFLFELAEQQCRTF